MPCMAIDLFCGIGGLTKGLSLAGIDVLAGFDIDESCQFAYEANNAAEFICEDVTNIEGAELNQMYPDNVVRALVGCAPCQPFDFNIAAQSYGGIGATVSWAYVTYGSQRYTLVISSTSEQIDAVLASYCTALAQLNTDCWKDFMSAYITGGWKLSGLNANYKLTDQKVRTYLDRSELLIRAIAGDEKAKTKLLESGSKDMKDKLKDMSNSAFRKYIKEHTKNGDKILKAADKYKKLSSKYKDWKNKYNTWKKSGKGTDLEKAEAACDQFKEILEELNLAISSM